MATGDMVYSVSGDIAYSKGGGGEPVYKKASLVATRSCDIYPYYYRGYKQTSIYGDWATIHPAAEADFDADTTLSGGAMERVDACTLTYGAYSYACWRWLGYYRIGIAASDKTGLDHAELQLRWLSSYYDRHQGPSPFIWGTSSPNPYPNYTVRFMLTDSPSSYGSGYALRTAVAHYEVSAATLEPLLTGYGAGTHPRCTYTFMIDNSYVTGLSGLSMYVWIYIHYSYDIPQFMSVGDDSAIKTQPDFLKLLIYK